MTKLRIAVAQFKNVVGDIAGNTKRIISEANRARDELGADLIVFPELVLSGYPPEDLLLRPGFHRRVEKALLKCQQEIKGIAALVSHSEQRGGLLYNAASMLLDGERPITWYKQKLPNYSVFDEKRYFTPGPEKQPLFEYKGVKIACLICEDIWEKGPIADVTTTYADCLLVVNASPFCVNKIAQRQNLLAKRVKKFRRPIFYVHGVGGQDEVVFDGASMVYDANGKLAMQAPFFEEGVYPVDLESTESGIYKVTSETFAEKLSEEEMVYKALVLGVKDYVKGNGFSGAIIGVSGGIDSALVLAIACDALGAENVLAVAMPSQYSAPESEAYALEEVKNLGCSFQKIPIEPIFDSFMHSLDPVFYNYSPDVTEQNLQARIRGTLLMAMSNKMHKMVLTTGNKSEMAVGYATLYGDMAGGFAVLRDVYKTWVYKLANYRNSIEKVIPEGVIKRAPTAELAPGQLDQDHLPPYEILDSILAAYVEADAGVEEIVSQGIPKAEVLRILRLVDSNEYKRRQAPPGIRVSSRSFGRDRRYPITSGYGRQRDIY